MAKLSDRKPPRRGPVSLSYWCLVGDRLIHMGGCQNYGPLFGYPKY